MTATQFGCIALLDALGTRTASLSQAQAYLESLSDIRAVISEFSLREDDEGWRGRVKEDHPGGEFRIRFFADSILITLPFDRQQLNWLPIARVFSGMSAIVATGMNRGILFRGAIAIGDYIESDDAVLGPAVLDAARWYEMPDMFGVIATPNAMFAIRRLLADASTVEAWPVRAVEGMGMPYQVPLKNGTALLTNVADWVYIAKVRSADAHKNIERWFFTVLQDCLVSPEVEAKYRQSLDFLRHCVSVRHRVAK